MTEGEPEVLVVGGGVAGCAVALELLRRGAGATVLDAGEEGRATPASAGMLAARYESEGDAALFRLGLWSRASHARFLSRVQRLSGRDPRLRADGMLVVNRDAGDEREAREAVRWQARRLGTSGTGPEPRLLSPDEATARHRWATADAESYLWLPGEAHVDARALAAALPEAVREAGGEVREEAAAALRVSGGRAAGVDLRGGDAAGADHVVVAAGAWSERLGGLPRPVPVRPVRGQMLRLEAPEEPPSPLLADHGGRYVVPRGEGTVLAGSTMEEAGFRPAVTGEGREAVRRGAAALAPPLEGARVVGEWSGLRPVTPDGRPVLGPDPGLPGLHYATGYGRNGILLAPAAATVVADLLLEGETEAEAGPFLADRF